MTNTAGLVKITNPRRTRYKLRSSKQTLLNLPSEIKIKIYKYVFNDVAIEYLDLRLGQSDDSEAYQPKSGELGYELLLASKACYVEAKDIYYKQIDIDIINWYPPSDFKFVAGIIRHVQEITIYTSLRSNYVPPNVICTLNNLKKVNIALLWMYISSDMENFRPTDEDLIKSFGWWVRQPFFSIPATKLRAMLPASVEVTFSVTFKHRRCHGTKIVSIATTKSYT